MEKHSLQNPKRTDYYIRATVTTALGFKLNEMDTEGGRKRKTLNTYPGPAPLLKLNNRKKSTEKVTTFTFNNVRKGAKVKLNSMINNDSIVYKFLLVPSKSFCVTC